MTRKILVAIFLTCLAFNSPARPSADNERLSEIFNEDQGARKTRPIDWAKVGAQDKEHRKEVLGLLRAGEIRTSNDFYYAAMVLQHGEATEDYQLAFSLSQVSATLDPTNKKARWLSAASWDRILMSKGVPQWYGTQYYSPAPGEPTEMYKIDESVVTDAERAAMNVPSLQEAKDLVLEINK